MTEQDIEQLQVELALARTVEALMLKLGKAETYEEILYAIYTLFADTDLNRITLFHFHTRTDAGNPTVVTVRATVPPLPDGSISVGLQLNIENFTSLPPLFEAGGKLMLSEAVATDPNIDPNLQQAIQQLGTQAIVLMPIVRLGEWIGLLTFAWTEPHPFTPYEKELFYKLSQLIPPFVQNRYLIETLETRVAERTQELERIRRAVEASTDGVAIIDENNLTLYYNPAMIQMTGYTGAEINAMGGGPSIFADQTLIGQIVETLQQGKSWTGETNINHKNGYPIAVLFRISPLINADGSYGGAVVIQTDMTDQKKIESERATMQQKIIETQQEALRTLSTPIIPIMDRVIILPLIGHIDLERASSIMRSLLHSISQERAKVVILDITGVPTLNSQVAGYLSKTIMAARLKGCRTIITGISDAVAETIIDLGISWGTDVALVGDLQSGLVAAVDYLERSWYRWQGYAQ